jgi:hypothetical protein
MRRVRRGREFQSVSSFPPKQNAWPGGRITKSAQPKRADVHTPSFWLDSTAASINATPRAPSSTFGVNFALASGVRPARRAEISSDAPR